MQAIRTVLGADLDQNRESALCGRGQRIRRALSQEELFQSSVRCPGSQSLRRGAEHLYSQDSADDNLLVGNGLRGTSGAMVQVGSDRADGLGRQGHGACRVRRVPVPTSARLVEGHASLRWGSVESQYWLEGWRARARNSQGREQDKAIPSNDLRDGRSGVLARSAGLL